MLSFLTVSVLVCLTMDAMDTMEAIRVLFSTHFCLFLVIMIILFLVIVYRAPATQWGDVSQAVIYHQVKKI